MTIKINFNDMQCRLIYCNKCTTLVGDSDCWGGCACGEQEVSGKSPYLPPTFPMNLQLL